MTTHSHIYMLYLKRAKKLNVIVDKDTSPEDFNEFYRICEEISKSKKFELGNSAKLMSNLLTINDQKNDVESCLLVARYQGKIARLRRLLPYQSS